VKQGHHPIFNFKQRTNLYQNPHKQQSIFLIILQQYPKQKIISPKPSSICKLQISQQNPHNSKLKTKQNLDAKPSSDLIIELILEKSINFSQFKEKFIKF
jgi:hypothetical protein